LGGGGEEAATYHLGQFFAWSYTRIILFFFGGGLGYIKVAVYVPPLATTLPELAGRVE
jgi:hypothetical protein